MNPDVIKKLRDFPAFQEFQQHIENEMADLLSFRDLEDMSNERAGEEAKVRSKTLKTLYNILSPFLNVTEKREASEQDLEKAGKKFGL